MASLTELPNTYQELPMPYAPVSPNSPQFSAVVESKEDKNQVCSAKSSKVIPTIKITYALGNNYFEGDYDEMLAKQEGTNYKDDNFSTPRSEIAEEGPENGQNAPNQQSIVITKNKESKVVYNFRKDENANVDVGRAGASERWLSSDKKGRRNAFRTIRSSSSPAELEKFISRANSKDSRETSPMAKDPQIGSNTDTDQEHPVPYVPVGQNSPQFAAVLAELKSDKNQVCSSNSSKVIPTIEITRALGNNYFEGDYDEMLAKQEGKDNDSSTPRSKIVEEGPENGQDSRNQQSIKLITKNKEIKVANNKDKNANVDVGGAKPTSEPTSSSSEINRGGNTSTNSFGKNAFKNVSRTIRRDSSPADLEKFTSRAKSKDSRSRETSPIAKDRQIDSKTVTKVKMKSPKQRIDLSFDVLNTKKNGDLEPLPRRHSFNENTSFETLPKTNLQSPSLPRRHSFNETTSCETLPKKNLQSPSLERRAKCPLPNLSSDRSKSPMVHANSRSKSPSPRQMKSSDEKVKLSQRTVPPVSPLSLRRHPVSSDAQWQQQENGLVSLDQPKSPDSTPTSPTCLPSPTTPSPPTTPRPPGSPKPMRRQGHGPRSPSLTNTSNFPRELDTEKNNLSGSDPSILVQNEDKPRDSNAIIKSPRFNRRSQSIPSSPTMARSSSTTPSVTSPEIERKFQAFSRAIVHCSRLRSHVFKELGPVARSIIKQASEESGDEMELPEVSMSDVLKSWKITGDKDLKVLNHIGVRDRSWSEPINMDELKKCRYLRNVNHDEEEH